MPLGVNVYDMAGKAIRLNGVVKKLFPSEIFFNNTVEWLQVRQ
jgi:hypothetical protein